VRTQNLEPSILYRNDDVDAGKRKDRAKRVRCDYEREQVFGDSGVDVIIVILNYVLIFI